MDLGARETIVAVNTYQYIHFSYIILKSYRVSSGCVITSELDS